MRKIVVGIIVICSIALLLYLMGYVLPYIFVSREDVANNSNCRDAKMANNEFVEGTVKRKFRDKDSHMWKTVEYAGDKGISFTTLIFRNDESGAYDFLMQGDSIIKKPGSLDLQVFRDGQKRIYKLEYGCK